MGQQPVKMTQNTDSPRSKEAKIMGQQPVVLQDLVIKMTCPNTLKNYPRELRMVAADVLVNKKWKRMTFLTNNMIWAASSICELYRSRWGVEVFFKEIKQTLQIADFMGTSENAIRWQIWIALLVYLLLRFLAWKHEWEHSFKRLFTLIRGVVWNFFDIESVMRSCKAGFQTKPRPPPLKNEQLEFEF